MKRAHRYDAHFIDRDGTWHIVPTVGGSYLECLAYAEQVPELVGRHDMQLQELRLVATVGVA